MDSASLSRGADLRDLWEQINQSDHIIIYCGAGVTQDRTGVSWTDLTMRVAAQAKSEILKNLSAPNEGETVVNPVSTALSHFFNDRNHSPEIKASVACSFANNDQDSIVSAIRESLYRDSGWSHGRLLSSLVAFVTLVSIQGKRVSVVTTNYDTYLEKAIDARLSELDANNDVPGLSVFAFDSSNPSDCCLKKRDLRSPSGSASAIELTYVHGRIDEVDEKTPLFGTLVFSEREYEANHARTLELLCKLFCQGTTLIVGSGLTDTPLVRGLLQTRREESGRGFSYKRYAVMRGRVTGDPYSEIIQQARSIELAIEPLFFEHYDDIPDIFLDLIALFTQKYEEYETGLPCDCAVNEWIRHAVFSREASKLGYQYSAELVRDRLISKVREGELLKVEFWFLDAEKRDYSHKVLRIWANSAGPIYTKGLRRNEPVADGLKSKVAAVRAFSSGRPILTTLSELGFTDASAGRWKSFLAVPIEFTVPKFQISVVVGVVTLASTYDVSPFGATGFFDFGQDLHVKTECAEESFLSSTSDNLRVDIVKLLRTCGTKLVASIFASEL